MKVPKTVVAMLVVTLFTGQSVWAQGDLNPPIGGRNDQGQWVEKYDRRFDDRVRRYDNPQRRYENQEWRNENRRQRYDNQGQRYRNDALPSYQPYQNHSYANDYRYERGAGPNHDFHRGARLPYEYRSRQYVVEDWRGHYLSAPPRGYHWVQTGSDYVLVAIATGIILQMLLNN